MQTALNRGKAALEAVPTARERVDHVVERWESDQSGALGYLAGGTLTQTNAAQALELARQALEAARQENLAGYCPLKGEEDLALVLGAASARIQPRVDALMTLTQAAQWLESLEPELSQRPMSQVRGEDLDAYQSALASYEGLDGALTACISPLVYDGLSARHELAAHKRSAGQTLQQEYETLHLEDYSAKGQASLAQILAAGQENIRTAASPEAVQQARRDAWAAMLQVPTADQEPVEPPAGGGGTGGGDAGGGTGGGGETGGGTGGGGGGGVPPVDPPVEPGEDKVTHVTDEKTGASAVVTTTAAGAVSAVVTLPQGVQQASLNIPCTPKPGTVAVLVKEDGTRRVLPKSVLTEDGLTVRLDASARIELVDNTQSHSDVGQGDWFAAPVGFVTSRDLFSGVDSSRFAPDLSMTRAMVVTVLHKLEGNPAAQQSHTFQDVPSGAWYAQAAGWAVEQGITGGVDETSFAPDAPIAREDLALMLYRCAQQMGLASGRGSLTGFGDGDQVSAWAREAVEWACANGILSGDNQGNLNPRSNSTRAEVAAMLTRFVELSTLA